MHTLKDIKNREYWLSNAYEQEFKKKLKSAINLILKLMISMKSYRLKI